MKSKMIPYRIARPILGLLFRLYYNPQIIGKENIPKEGAIILAGNHKHLFDQNMVIISTKRCIHYLAKKEYFEGKFAWFFKLVGCISVDRNGHDSKAKSAALEVLNSKQAVGIFPEGTRNRSDKLLLPFKYGCVSLAKKSGARIVPFAIIGDYKFRSKVKIIFSKPFKVIGDLEEANKRLEKEIMNLLTKSVK